MATYERIVDNLTDKYLVMQVVPNEESRVVADCGTAGASRASQIAALLTADEA